jgi:hypothetical protein
MKTLKLISGIFTVSMLFSSCNSHEHADHDDHANHSEMENHDGHDHDNESAVLNLNKGKKWEVNSEMMIPVRDMEKRIHAFATSDKKDYSSLAVELKSDLDKLTSSCTMTGESHDQLHIWLLPHMELVDELSDAEDDKKSQRIFAEIQASMITFNDYFE